MLGGSPGAIMTTRYAFDVTLTQYQVAFSGEHGIPGMVTFSPGTTAQYVVSIQPPHWGILFQGPLAIGPDGDQKTKKFVLLDLYVDEIRFQGNNDQRSLLQGSGFKHAPGAEIIMGTPTPVKPILNHLAKLGHVNTFYQQSGYLKPFDMSDSPQPTPAQVHGSASAHNARYPHVQDFQNLPCRWQSPDLQAFEQSSTTNGHKFAKILGYYLGLKKSPLVAAVDLFRWCDQAWPYREVSGCGDVPWSPHADPTCPAHGR